MFQDAGRRSKFRRLIAARFIQFSIGGTRSVCFFHKANRLVRFAVDQQRGGSGDSPEIVPDTNTKPLSDLHADGRLGSKHAQVGADLAVENLSKLEIVEFAQALSEQAGYQQRRR